MTKGIKTEHLDPQVAPGEDFYKYVNGGWMKETEIPEDRSSWGSFHELGRDTDNKVLAILDHELREKGPSSNIAARLFESGMDTAGIESSGLRSIQRQVQLIDKLKEKSGLPALLGRLMPFGLSPFIDFSIHPDLGDSRKYAPYLSPGTLGLPERDFYLEEDDKASRIRDKYENYIRLLFKEIKQEDLLSGEDFSAGILLLEKVLAEKMMSKEDRRQLDKLYNPYSATEFLSAFPWDWESFFNAMEVSIPERIIITDPEYLKFIISFFRTGSVEEIKRYLNFLLIHHSAPYAHSSLEKAYFDLYSKTLEGVDIMKPRAERIVKVVNQLLGEALGQLFVSKHFPPEAKETALEMTGDIVSAFRERISQLEWMSPSTKSYALQKLEAFKVKIGYPGKWKDYDGLFIDSAEGGGNYLQNILAAVEWKFRKETKRINQEVDRDEWFMAPQVVNAYYNPMFNEIVFPAAILQPPFFDWEADAAINYGGIGAVIGHEITHGFDDQGSKFDKEGNFSEWWSADDRERFKELTTRLISQFDAYYPFEDLSLNGTFTLGENIADLGGLSVAYDALQLYFKRHGKPGRVDGLTPEQRFFMSWATVWRTKIRPEALRTQIKTDPHPPGMYRAVAAPSNLDAFYDAFEIFPDSPWYRPKEKRIKIW